MKRAVRPSERPRARGSVRLFPLDGAGEGEEVPVCDESELAVVEVVVAVVVKGAAVGGNEASPDVGIGSELSTRPALPDVCITWMLPPNEDGRKAVCSSAALPEAMVPKLESQGQVSGAAFAGLSPCCPSPLQQIQLLSQRASPST